MFNINRETSILKSILPKYIIVKTVLVIDNNNLDFYFISENVKLSNLNNFLILSKKPLIIRQFNKFYHIKKLDFNNFILIKYLLDHNDDYGYNDKILENYFLKNSTEI